MAHFGVFAKPELIAKKNAGSHSRRTRTPKTPAPDKNAPHNLRRLRRAARLRSAAMRTVQVEIL